MRKLYTLCVILAICVSSIHAQQDAMFTKYMFNTLVYNPAFAGSPGYMSLRALHRNQWWGLDGGPNTSTFSIHTPIDKKIGLGFHAISDKIGVVNSTTGTLSYAYHIPAGKGKIAIGLSTSFVNWKADWGELTYRDPQNTDLVYAGENPNEWYPNFGAGIYYYSKYFYLGASAPKILENELRDPNGTLQEIATLYRHYYFSAGAAIPLSGALTLKPSILVKTVRLFENSSKNSELPIKAPNEFDLDLGLLFYDVLWIGASFRSSFEKIFQNKSSTDSADIWAAFYFANGLRIGAAYDYTLTEIQDPAKGSFEIMLGYDFNYKVKRLVTPRYF